MSKARSIDARYHLLDEVRGLAVICMVVYHALYLLGNFFNVAQAQSLFEFFMPAEPYFAGAFIFISGICCCFSRSNLKRGIKLLAVAIALNIATYLIKYIGIYAEIKFGILNLLAVCMILAALLLPLVKKIPWLLGAALCALLFLTFCRIDSGVIGIGPLSFTLPEGIMQNPYLFPLGIHTDSFYSADYFPIFPWIFVFIAGMFAGVPGMRGKYPKFMSDSHTPFLARSGRSALLVYIVHQPVIYGISWLVFKLIDLLK